MTRRGVEWKNSSFDSNHQTTHTIGMSVIVASPQTFTCCPASELDGQEESPQDVVDQRIKDLLRVIQERCQIEFTLLVGEFRRPDQMIYGDEGTVWGPEFALMEIWRNACDA